MNLYRASAIMGALSVVAAPIVGASEQVYMTAASAVLVVNPDSKEVSSISIDGYPLELAVGPGGREVFVLLVSSTPEGEIKLLAVDAESGGVRTVVSTPVSSCVAGDINLDGDVTVDDLVRATTAALDGCP